MPKPIIQTLLLEEAEFAPLVLKSYYFSAANYQPHQRLKERYVFDYELEYITESDGSMTINDKLYKIKKGDITFRKPGDFTQGIMPYSCFAVFFDVKGTMGKNTRTYDIHEQQAYQPLYCNPILDNIPVVTHSSLGRNYQELFSDILNETINPKTSSVIRSRALVLNLLQRLYRDAMNPVSSLRVISGPHYHTLKKALAFIELHLDKKLALDELSHIAGLSPNYFHAIFSKVMGVTPNAYITNLKIRRAKELLAGTDQAIAEISERCGFENIPYFSYLFGKKIGISPSEFRREYSPRL